MATTNFAQTVDLSAPATKTLSFNESDIANVQFLEGDRALITLQSGGLYLLKNLDVLSGQSKGISMLDGSAFSAQTLSVNSMVLSDANTADDIQAGFEHNDSVDKTMVIDPLNPLVLGVNAKDVLGANIVDDALILSLENGQNITISNVVDTLAQNPDASIYLDDSVVTLSDFLMSLDVDVTAIDGVDMAALAEQLAAVEPAAGDGAAAQNSGYSFASASSAAFAQSPAAFGAINSTALNYGLVTTSPDDAFNVSFDSTTGEPIFTPRSQLPTASVNGPNSDSAQVYEDGSVFIPITADLNDINGDEVLSLTLTGVPSDWTLTGANWIENADGSYSYNGLAAGQNYDGGVTLSPAADSDVDVNNLTLTATATEVNGGDVASVTRDIDIVTDAVADTPDIVGTGDSGQEGDVLAINISAALNDLDGSETLSGITISGVPSGFTLSAGSVQSNGDWIVNASDFGSVSITPPSNYDGTLSLTARVTATESNVSDDEITTGNNTASNQVSFTVSWDDAPVLIVEDNTNDVISGGAAADILVGDNGGATSVQPTQDYNLNIIVDTTGSLQGQFSVVQQAINNLLNQIGGYDAGTIRVNIVPFSQVQNNSGTWEDTDITPETANATSSNGLDDLLDFVTGLNAYGTTNFEATLAQAADIISDNSLSNATTYSLFISDGDANTYTNASGDAVFTPYITDSNDTQNRSDVLDQINGDTDGSDEIAALHALSDEVFSVIINDNPSAEQSEIMDAIDSNGSSDVLNDADDLLIFANLFNAAATVTALADVGNDVISGNSGDDILFGDVLFTDDLADAYGIGTADGTGWAVFEQLEQRSDWSRTDTINYISDNAQALAEESNINGEVREGGRDTMSGGAGHDVMFGQEGNDVMSGDAGNDVIYGGSGDDLLSGGAGADTFGLDGGYDTVSDFSVSQGDVIDLSSYLSGFNSTQDSITDFVRITDNGSNSIVSVDANGNGQFTAIATLNNVTGLTDEQSLYDDGTIAA